jgi:hypothetical protein
MNGCNASGPNPPAQIEREIKAKGAMMNLLRKLNRGRKAIMDISGIITNHCNIPIRSKETEIAGCTSISVTTLR